MSDLNQTAAHDTGLYDPDRHDNHIVALYDTDEQARAARDILMRSNVPDTAIQLVSKSAGTMGEVRHDKDDGIWGMIRSMFAGDQDRNEYEHAVGRGHAVLMVTPTQGIDRTQLVRALEATHPVDFDARLEEWRQAGYDTSTPHPDFAQQRTHPMNDPARHQPATPETQPPATTPWREPTTGPVRSYVQPRPTALPGYDQSGTRTATSGTAQPEPAQGASTAGAQTSGANTRI